MENNKAAGNDWFRLESNKEGTRWFGKCWHVQDLLKYEFDIEFDVSGLRNSIAFTVTIIILQYACFSRVFLSKNRQFLLISKMND